MMYKRNETVTKMDPFAKCLYSIYGPDTPFNAVFGE